MTDSLWGGWGCVIDCASGCGIFIHFSSTSTLKKSSRASVTCANVVQPNQRSSFLLTSGIEDNRFHFSYYRTSKYNEICYGGLPTECGIADNFQSTANTTPMAVILPTMPNLWTNTNILTFSVRPIIFKLCVSGWMGVLYLQDSWWY